MGALYGIVNTNLTVETLARALYEADGQELPWSELFECGRGLWLTRAAIMLQVLCKRGVLDMRGERYIAIRPWLVRADEMAIAYLAATTPEVAAMQASMQLRAWQVQQEAVREGYLEMMQLVLDRLLEVGALG